MTDSQGLDPAWGAQWDQLGLRLRPVLTPGTTLRADRVRFGRTVLDLAARRHRDRLVIRLAKRFGPDLSVSLALAGPDRAVSVFLDDHALAGREIRFIASGEHEAQWYLADPSG